jgi:hypothetical protein
MWDAMLLQLGQPILTNVFQLTKKIEMNIVEERVVILGFNKKTQEILEHHCVTTLALGSQPRQRGCKGAGQEEARESHQRLLGV